MSDVPAPAPTLTGPLLATASSLSIQYKIPLSHAEYIVKAAYSVGGNPWHLAKVIWHESRFNPQAQYGYIYGPPGGVPLPGLATGLIQFTPTTLQRLGSSTEAAYRMTFEQQMALVQRYLMLVAAGEWTGDNGGVLDTQAKMALAVFFPKYRNYPLDTPLPAAAQAANPGIRTLGDYVNRVTNQQYRGYTKKVETPAPPPDGGGGGPEAALLIGGLAVVGIVGLILASSGRR